MKFRNAIILFVSINLAVSSIMIIDIAKVNGMPFIKRDYYIDAPQININNNDGFNTSIYVTGGNGSQSNPWRIEGYHIANVTNCIRIQSVTVYFVIQNCLLEYAYDSEILLKNTYNGIIRNNTIIEGFNFGVEVVGGTNIKFINNTVKRSVYMHGGVANFRVENNNFESGGILIDLGLDGIIQNNTMRNSGISLNDCSMSIIEKNRITGDQSDSIHIMYSDSNYIMNNSISNYSKNISGLNRAIYVNSSDNNYINNNSLNGWPTADIMLVSSDNSWIWNNNISSHNGYGIAKLSSNNAQIFNNSISDHPLGGIYLSGCYDDNINNNSLNNNTPDIILEESRTCIITNNEMIRGGISISGDQTSWTSHEIDTTNVVNGRPLYYVKNQVGGTVPLGASQIILANTQNVRISHQNFSNITTGIQMGYTYASTIDNNTFNNCDKGINAAVGNNNDMIVNNNFSYNDRGIYILYGNNQMIHANNLYKNQRALECNGGSGTVWHNNFIENTDDAVDLLNCFLYFNLDNGYPLGGNYWSKYIHYDNNSGINQNIPGCDSFGDSLQQIGPSGYDHYPLMHPFGYTDGTKPFSNVIQTEYWNNAASVHLNGMSSDPGSGTKNLTLWFQYSTDNVTWGNWSRHSTAYNYDWSWTFDFPNGDGFYRFYSIATDNQGNIEDAPTTYDCCYGRDSTQPCLNITPIQALTTGETFSFNATSWDINRISQVQLVYQYEGGVLNYVSMTPSSNNNFECNITITSNSVVPLNYSYTSTDIAGNVASSSTFTTPVIDNDRPVANAVAPQTIYSGQSATFNGSLSSDNIGVTNYSWNFIYENTLIKLFGVQPSFNFSVVDIYIINLNITDAAGNWATDLCSLAVVPAVVDSDGDGLEDGNDTDDDNDGTPDDSDAFPLDPTENTDSDGDGAGDNADLDDDNDGVPDTEDAFPLDSTEWMDTDGDGIGDNADLDDDGDVYLDTWEILLGTDPKNSTDRPLVTDGDGIPNGDSTNSQSWMDMDDDGDGTADVEDYDPLDPNVTNASESWLGNNILLIAIIIVIIVCVVIIAIWKMMARKKKIPPSD